jgi:hypothetical protein
VPGWLMQLPRGVAWEEEGEEGGEGEWEGGEEEGAAGTWLLKRSASKGLPYWVSLDDPGVAVWEKPPPGALIIPAWIKKLSSRNRAFYVNVIDGSTSWQRPAEYVSGSSAASLAQLGGGSGSGRRRRR